MPVRPPPETVPDQTEIFMYIDLISCSWSISCHTVFHLYWFN